MITTRIGRQAEDFVAARLKKAGYQIIARNWRTRFCEIDIVASRAKTIFFVEVKFRTSDSQGDGLEYITARKLRQMRFAAEYWCSENDWSGDWRLMAAAVRFDGRGYELTNSVEVS